MHTLISFLRTSKTARIALAVFLVFSFVAVSAHHHEANHGYDCSVCHAVQTLALNFAVILFFVWVSSVSSRRFVAAKSAPLFALFHGAILSNRAPPVFA